MSRDWPPQALDPATLQAALQGSELSGSAQNRNNRVNPQALVQSIGNLRLLGGSNNHQSGASDQLYQRPRSAEAGNTILNSQAAGQMIGRPASAESRSGRSLMPKARQVAGQYGPIGPGNTGFNPQAPSQGNGRQWSATFSAGEYSSQNQGQANGQGRSARVGGQGNEGFSISSRPNVWQSPAGMEGDSRNPPDLYHALLQAQSQGDGATIARLQGQLLGQTQGNRYSGGNSETGSYGPEPLYYGVGPSSDRAASTNILNLTNDRPSPPARPAPYSVPNMPAGSPFNNPDEADMLPSQEYLTLFHQAAAACGGPRARPPTPPSGTSQRTANTTESDCIRLHLQQLRQQRLAASQSQRDPTLAYQGARCPNGTTFTDGTDDQPPQCVMQR